jgi:hypothetical protein
MGRYFPSHLRRIRGQLQPSVTWGEYRSALAQATGPRDAAPAPDRADGLAPLAPRRLDPASMALLRTRVRDCPMDGAAQRLLGLGHAAEGRPEEAVRHLEVALGLLRLEARRAVGLGEALRLECEAATLRMVLMGLHRRLGNAQRLRALAQVGQTVL